MGPMNAFFRKVAHTGSEATGSPWAFIIAVGIIAIWAVSGPLFAFSSTWQLVINTGTTMVTFLMVFLIQNTQNRDAKAVHLKLDELLRGVEGARTHLVDLEDLTDDELDDLQEQFQRIRERDGQGPAPTSAASAADGGASQRATEGQRLDDELDAAREARRR